MAVTVRFADRETLRTLQTPWRALMQDALAGNPFLDPDFALPYISHVDTAPRNGAWIIDDNQQWIGLFPLGTSGGLRTVQPFARRLAWSLEFVPLSLPLLRRGAETAAIDALLSHGRKPQLLPMMDETSPVAAALRAGIDRQGLSLKRINAHQRAALTPLAPDWNGLSANHARKLRAQARKLAEQGTVEYRSTVSGLGFDEAFAAFVTVENASWKGGRGTALAQQRDARAFYEQAVRAMEQAGHARIDMMTLDDRPIAVAVTLLMGGRAITHKIAYDPEFAAFSPGVLNCLNLSEQLHADPRLSVVDSCALPGHPMVDKLWSGRIAIADWLIGRGPLLQAARLLESSRHAAIAKIKAVRATRGG